MADLRLHDLDPNAPRKRVVVVGAGFGGLNVAKGLGNRPGVEVILIDRRNYHLFQPLLYQVATAALSPADIAVPIRAELARYRNVEVHLGQVEHVDLAERLVTGGGVAVRYDYLVLACGAKHSYFGKPEWEPFAPGLKTLEQATEIRYRVLSAFEHAENEDDPARRAAYLTFVVVGGGPTGVELAGALAEIARTVLVKDFRRIDPRETRIVLVEAGPRILTMFTEDLSARAVRDLGELGVDVRTNQMVVDIDADGVTTGDGARLTARTVLWAAGVQPSGLNPRLGVPLDRHGRVVVGSDLSLPSDPRVFVIGDQAHAEQDGKPLPGLAPVAMQQGWQVAENILRELKGQPRRPFHYLDKGQMATIGKRRAVAETGAWHFGGWLAWLAWLFIHVLYLVGFRNRLSVMTNWVWSYIFSKRSARLIVGKTWRSYGDSTEI